MTKYTKKLFLLDGMALIYRAYFAFSKNPRINSKGFNTSAVLGFTNTLVDILKKEKPSHIAVAFDTMAPTTRHDDFTEYKANREAMPEDLAASIPWIRKVIEGFRIPLIELDGYEADDVIGTLSCKAEKAGFTTYMMTPDKDFGQLVTEHTLIYKPPFMGNKAQVMGIQQVLEKFKVKRTDQVIDILGLWGDSVDNIPGIPGVGEKTAQQLISDYDNVENIIANADKLKGKLKEKVIAFADQAILSKKLATIICDVPIEFKEQELLVEVPDAEMLTQIFAELEFRTLAKRVLGDDHVVSSNTQSLTMTDDGNIGREAEIVKADAEPMETILTVKHSYHLADTPEKIKQLIGKLSAVKSFCFDTETTGIDANEAELVGMSFSISKGEAWYVPVADNYAEAHETVAQFKPLLENEAIQKVGQNIKYDMILLKWYDVEVKGPIFDTMLAHYLLEPDMRHNMNVLAETYLNYSPVHIEDLIGEKKSTQITMREVAVGEVKEYASEDADVTMQLKEKFEPLLEKNKLSKLFNEVETPLIPVLVKMETEGVTVDSEVLVAMSGELEKDIAGIEKEIFDSSGTEFNIASPKQLGEVLFDHLKIDAKAKKTKTGQYATGEDVLSKIADKHPVINMVLDYRELQKLKSTYVDTLPKMVNQRTGRIHTQYNQTVASTGRLSSINPNLQNIPIRTEKGREIRKAFVPRSKEHTLLSADYSQIELRLVASVSGDNAMIEDFNQALDIHTATASKVYDVTIEEVTAEMRRNAKMVNFGIIYGISAFGLSQRLNIPRKEAAHIIEQYFKQYPDIKAYMDGSIAFARDNGYVETLLGRKRYLRDINSRNATVRGFAERNAINAPIQGSAADMIKVAMINVHNDIQKAGMRSAMILQVHDELVFDALISELDELKVIVKQRMESALPLKVPVLVEMGTGSNWLQAH